jgi:nicotinamide-nucleotide amidase
MIAELITIGTELLLGETTDTNSAYLARALKDRGVDTFWAMRVGDNQARIAQAIREALSRADLVITTGGLGPTGDDVTREAIAEVLGETPTVDPELERYLRGFFERVGRKMPETNVKQAWLVPSAEALPNPKGTAPGWYARKNGKVIIALPGPPNELVHMWREQVVPRLPLADAFLYVKTYRTVGIGESHLEDLIRPQTSGTNPTVATYAREDGVHVRLAAKGPDRETARQLAARTEAALDRALADYWYGSDDETLPQVIGRMLWTQNAWLATAESCTGGMVASLITEVPGCSLYFMGGMVSYSVSSKTALGVLAPMLEKEGTVSEAAASALAAQARAFFGSTYTLATTGVAGPDPVEGKPVGLIYIGLAGPEGIEVKEHRLPAVGRSEVKRRAAYLALAQLWRRLRG